MVLAEPFLSPNSFGQPEGVGMCKEDVRISRKTAAKSVVKTPAGVTAEPVFPARPDRVAIVFSFSGTLVPNPDAMMLLQTEPSATSPVLAAITLGRPSTVLRLEDVGILITYPIYLSDLNTVGESVTITEVFFTEALNDL